MTLTASPAYDALAAAYTRMHHLAHLQSIASWDQAANMPPKGNEARAEAMAEMAALLHRISAFVAARRVCHNAACP